MFTWKVDSNEHLILSVQICGILQLLSVCRMLAAMYTVMQDGNKYVFMNVDQNQWTPVGVQVLYKKERISITKKSSYLL